MIYCSYCDKPMTDDEEKFNRNRCDKCERKKRNPRSDNLAEFIEEVAKMEGN